MLDVLTVRLISLSKPVDPNMSKKSLFPSRAQSYKVYANKRHLLPYLKIKPLSPSLTALLFHFLHLDCVTKEKAGLFNKVGENQLSLRLKF